MAPGQPAWLCSDTGLARLWCAEPQPLLTATRPAPGRPRCCDATVTRRSEIGAAPRVAARALGLPTVWVRRIGARRCPVRHHRGVHLGRPVRLWFAHHPASRRPRRRALSPSRCVHPPAQIAARGAQRRPVHHPASPRPRRRALSPSRCVHPPAQIAARGAQRRPVHHPASPRPRRRALSPSRCVHPPAQIAARGAQRRPARHRASRPPPARHRARHRASRARHARWLSVRPSRRRLPARNALVAAHVTRVGSKWTCAARRLSELVSRLKKR